MPRYEAYLVRIWRGESAADERWAGKIQHLPRGEIHRFGSLEDLLAALRHLLTTAETAGPAGNEPPGDDESAQT
jgi:hypothetical protein